MSRWISFRGWQMRMDPERLDPKVACIVTALAKFILVIRNRRVAPIVLDLMDNKIVL